VIDALAGAADVALYVASDSAKAELDGHQADHSKANHTTDDPSLIEGPSLPPRTSV
jgi:hypothetical protein